MSLSQGTAFTVVNNFIYRNGSISSAYGAASILATATDVFEFNTITAKLADDGNPAFACSGSQAVIRNNIIYNNTDADPSNGGVSQVAGNCIFRSNILGPNTNRPNNPDVDPLFVDPPTRDYHLQAGSPASDQSDPGSSLSGLLATDFDGDPRPAPVGQRADLGADEIP
jgi:hypothetical protein